MEWVRIDPNSEEGLGDDLKLAISNFQPVDATRDADLLAADWLQEKAPFSVVDVWLLTDGRAVAAYHSACEAELMLPTGAEVATIHTGFAARDAFHRGGGEEIVNHLIALAREQRLNYVSLDPFDHDTEAMWERHGFLRSLTHAQEDPSSPEFRMWRHVA
jgi:hypothetical protein